MKKILLTVVAIFAMSTMANAQIKDLGVRGAFGAGAGAELSAMWDCGLLGANRLETDLGWAGNKDWGYINLTGIVQWTGDLGSNFGWFAGVGANLGLYNGNDADYDGFGLGLAAQVGLEYNFSIPIQLTLDFRPGWSFIGHSGFGYGVALGIRYRF
jgi:hypothetical protein